MKPAQAILCALLLAAPTAAFAWGPNGHRIVGRIAENHLTDEASRAVACLIGPESLAQVSTWPDEIRSDPAWKKSAPWHYISIDDGETLTTTQRDPAGDVLEALQRFEAALRDPQATPDAKREALKFLVHFVGDVHQPLHVGRRDDLGGNRVEAFWFAEKTNLHSVWDFQLIENVTGRGFGALIWLPWRRSCGSRRSGISTLRRAAGLRWGDIETPWS